jgi:hypothetical protein
VSVGGSGDCHHYHHHNYHHHQLQHNNTFLLQVLCVASLNGLKSRAIRGAPPAPPSPACCSPYSEQPINAATASAAAASGAAASDELSFPISIDVAASVLLVPLQRVCMQPACRCMCVPAQLYARVPVLVCACVCVCVRVCVRKSARARTCV